MKGLSSIQKVIFFVNNIAALLLLMSALLPYIPPKSASFIAVWSLAVPVVLLSHVIFLLYWILVGFKKPFLLSAICLCLAIITAFFPYKFNGKNNSSAAEVKVMSYNVRLFNTYNWIKKEDIPQKISSFISNELPDILAIQEFSKTQNTKIEYPYKYIQPTGKQDQFGLAIYSNYKIIDKGSLNLENTSNNIIFADIKIKNDTVRVYNIHLESFGLEKELKEMESFDESKSKKIYKRVAETFEKQQEQVEQFLQHKAACAYKTIICGDFNNTSYSWAYKTIKGDLQDSFLQAGKAIGKTFSLKRFPLRIDFILTDTEFEILRHQNYNLNLSDHQPILTAIEF